jgi:hypothetical protein
VCSSIRKLPPTSLDLFGTVAVAMKFSPVISEIPNPPPLRVRDPYSHQNVDLQNFKTFAGVGISRFARDFRKNARGRKERTKPCSQ